MRCAGAPSAVVPCAAVPCAAVPCAAVPCAAVPCAAVPCAAGVPRRQRDCVPWDGGPDPTKPGRGVATAGGTDWRVRSGGGASEAAELRCHDPAIGEDLAHVVEQHDPVAEQAPALLRVADEDVGGVGSAASAGGHAG